MKIEMSYSTDTTPVNYPYLTRSIARRQTSASTETLSLAGINRLLHNAPNDCRGRLVVDLSKSIIAVSAISPSTQVEPYEETMENRELRRRCRQKWKTIRFLVILAMLSYTTWVLRECYTETVRSNILLQRVKTEMKALLKHPPERSTQLQLESFEMETREKLSIVEKLLNEIKHSYKEQSDGLACGSESDNNEQNEENEEKSAAIRVFVMGILDDYNADKTGKTDFALESSGGSIYSTLDTQPYNSNPGFSVFGYGVSLCDEENGPSAMLRASVRPGECWSFKGSCGRAIIQLLGHIILSSITLEHISKKISPTGEIISAPKDFSLHGLSKATDTKGHCFGRFTYDRNGPSLQHFPIDGGTKSYQFVQFTVHSNHGNPNYTCVYRLRVHGTLDAAGTFKAGK